jgi:triosephosphate isomerase
MNVRKLVAGNWKMHGLAADLGEVKSIADQATAYPQVDVALCLPAILIERAARAVPGFAIGGQDVHPSENGAYTGCTSSRQLLDAGATLTIVGHSERREGQFEKDADVKAKAEAALGCGLDVILCIGESLDVREAGRAVETVVAQLRASLPVSLSATAELAIAYEPIWAIGTGKIPTTEEIGEMHSALRQCLKAVFSDAGSGVRILYGGSVKPSNASEIFSVQDVDGALVGGASLKAADFIPIVAAAAAVEG